MLTQRKPITRRQTSIFETLEGRRFMSASTLVAPSTSSTGSTAAITADQTPTTDTTIHDISITKNLDVASS